MAPSDEVKPLADEVKPPADYGEVVMGVSKIVAERLGKSQEEIIPTTKISDLKLDSLDTVEIVMELEEKFAIRLPDEDVSNTLAPSDVTVAELVNLVWQKLTPNTPVGT